MLHALGYGVGVLKIGVNQKHRQNRAQIRIAAENLCGTVTDKDEVKKAAAAKGNIFQRVVKTLGDVFVPIIPAIVAGGLIMGIMEALNFMANNNIISINQYGYFFRIINF